MIINLFEQMNEAICYIHRCGIIHSDIKHKNLMVKDLGNEKFRVYVIDMGGQEFR